MTDNREVRAQYRIITLGGGIASKPTDSYPTNGEIETFMKSMPPHDMYFQVEKLFSLEEPTTLRKEPPMTTVADIAEQENRYNRETFALRKAIEVKIYEVTTYLAKKPKAIFLTVDMMKKLMGEMGMAHLIGTEHVPAKYQGIPINIVIGIEEPFVGW